MEKYPEVFTRYMQREEKYQIPEGESLVSFYNRVIDGVNAIAQSHSGKRILIVTHGGVLDCMMRRVFNYPLSAPRSFSIYNASVNRFSITDGVWFLEEWGDISHQESMALSLDI
jgi:broad specificity phosphatase PhoE